MAEKNCFISNHDDFYAEGPFTYVTTQVILSMSH